MPTAVRSGCSAHGLSETVPQAILELPEAAWIQAVDAVGADRDGTWMAELTDGVVLSV